MLHDSADASDSLNNGLQCGHRGRQIDDQTTLQYIYTFKCLSDCPVWAPAATGRRPSLFLDQKS